MLAAFAGLGPAELLVLLISAAVFLVPVIAAVAVAVILISRKPQGPRICPHCGADLLASRGPHSVAGAATHPSRDV